MKRNVEEQNSHKVDKQNENLIKRINKMNLTR
jgi:hypothetical protein